MKGSLGALCLAVLWAKGHASAKASGGHDKSDPLKVKMPWYHSTQEIHDEVADIALACKGAQMEVTTRTEMSVTTEVPIQVVKVRKAGATPRTKSMFVFGEHSRELVSPESGLDFLRTLCGEGIGGSRVSALLDNVEFIIVPNANPLGRQKVEEGYYCKRTNENNVDLNRNWGDDHRQNAGMFMGDEMDPGPSGFSEPETKILKALADEERPDSYLSIHTGAYLLGAPYGYTQSKLAPHEASMVEILGPISQKYCNGQCPYGGLAELIGYDSMGCDVDYMAEKLNTPFAYTWEIYVGPAIRKHYIEEAADRSGQGGDDMLIQEDRWAERKSSKGLRAMTARTTQARKEGRLKALYESPESEQNWDSCIEQFNPRTESETRAVVENWSGAYLDLAESVDGKRHPAAGNAPAKTGTKTSPVAKPHQPDYWESTMSKLRGGADPFAAA